MKVIHVLFLKLEEKDKNIDISLSDSISNSKSSLILTLYNNEYNMRGSRTPFVDYRTGQNVYNKRGFTPGQNQYSDIPNRPPSRPFGDISFKGQQNGGDNYQRNNSMIMKGLYNAFSTISNSTSSASL